MFASAFQNLDAITPGVIDKGRWLCNENRAEEAMKRLIQQLIESQTPEGSWDYPFETGISTDAYMIILLRTLEMDDEDLIRQLTTKNFKQTRN